jgi:hypothetical protein
MLVQSLLFLVSFCSFSLFIYIYIYYFYNRPTPILILPETIHRAVNGHVAKNIKYKNINPNTGAHKSRAPDRRDD